MPVLVTNVCEYTGPGVVPALLRDHAVVFCHDRSFANVAARHSFEAAHPGAVALSGQTPSELVTQLGSSPHLASVPLTAVVHNDVHPNTPLPIEAIPADHFQGAWQALYMFPVQLTQLLLPAMKQARQGRWVFVTSARHLQPEPGFAVATSIRAATTAFAQALAREAAPHQVQVNVVEPNYLYSEAYYPRATFLDTEEGRARIAARVPMGRLGDPAEVGELIAFLVSGRSTFVTGQVIGFTGGWP